LVTRNQVQQKVMRAPLREDVVD